MFPTVCFVLCVFISFLDKSGPVAASKREQGPPRFVRKPGVGPQFLAWPPSIDIRLRCDAFGERPLRYRWLKDGKALTYRRIDPSFPRMRFNVTKSILRIKTAVTEDGGIYVCVVSNRLGSISQEFRLKVIENAITKPRLLDDWPANKTARVGESVTFGCVDMFGLTFIFYKWLHWNKRPPKYVYTEPGFPSANSSYYTIINARHYAPFGMQISGRKFGENVTLKNVTKEDEGMYTCVATNYLGTSWKSAFLEVIPNSGPKPKFVDNTTRSYEAKLGKTVRLECDVLNWEHGWAMAWYRNGIIVMSGNDKRFQIENGKSSFLRIDEVQSDDAGMYQCVASNKYGSISKRQNLTVIVARRYVRLAHYNSEVMVLQTKENNVSVVYEGHNVTVLCIAVGYDLAHFLWLFNNAKKNITKVLPSDLSKVMHERITDDTQSVSQLQLLNVTSQDEGDYHCLAGDNRGYDKENFHLIVLPRNS